MLGLDPAALFGGIYRGKRVLVTGHTGFKGSWLCIWLRLLGARVTGFALPPATGEDNFVLAGLADKIDDRRGDIRDAEALRSVFAGCKPEVVFHLAAQPLVRLSYEQPALTLETNIMGTANLLEALRLASGPMAAVLIASDKCYENREQIWGYRENDPLGGHDPYSASKGCAELVAACYQRSFFDPARYAEHGKAVATARAGNVIGGGDWSPDRIVPDCIRALRAGRPIVVRNPHAVRPWQHVLEPLYGYLLLGERLLREGPRYGGPWNFGPDFEGTCPVNQLVTTLVALWGEGSWSTPPLRQNAGHESSLLALDCTRAKSLLGWRPRWDLHKALSSAIGWYKRCGEGDAEDLCRRQICDYLAGRASTASGPAEIAQRPKGGMQP
jgi:CDP-glucose 4,6-dehydratase